MSLAVARRRLVVAVAGRLRAAYDLGPLRAEPAVQAVTVVGTGAADVHLFGELCHAVGADAARYALVRTRWNRPVRVDLDRWSRRDERNPLWRLWYLGVGSREALDVARAHGIEPAPGGRLEGRAWQTTTAALDAIDTIGRVAAERGEPHRLADHLEHDVATSHEAVRRWAFEGLSRIRDDPTGRPAAAYRSHLALLARCADAVARAGELFGVPLPRRL